MAPSIPISTSELVTSAKPVFQEASLFRYTIRKEGSLLMVSLGGELDGTSVNSLRDSIAESLTNSECRDLVADMSELTYIGSSGVGALVHSMQLLQGGSVYLAGCSLQVRRIFAVTRLDRVFHLYDTVSDALFACQAKRKKS